jgi:hypothetical protein
MRVFSDFMAVSFLFRYAVTLISGLIALGFATGKISRVSANIEYEKLKLGIEVQAPLTNLVSHAAVSPSPTQRPLPAKKDQLSLEDMNAALGPLEESGEDGSDTDGNELDIPNPPSVLDR